ncbi:MAG: hypothetical protein JEZ02_10690 [Desulfatibacillum sp.]|nr:hypothetical protein [Desulfatibacillum sp.]
MSMRLNGKVRAALAITICIALLCLIGYGCRSFGREKLSRQELEAINWIESLGGKIETGYTPWSGKTVGHAIDLSGTKVRDNELNQLSKLAPMIRALDLSQTGIDGSGLPNLTKNCSIFKLSLHHTMVTTESLCRFIDGVEIFCLDLSDTPITDEAIKCLMTIRNDVGCLDLSSTQVTIAGLSRLKEIALLREVNLRNLPLKDDDIPVLMDLLRKEHDLWSLDLRGTEISEAAVAELRDKLRGLHKNTEIIFGEEFKDAPKNLRS